MMRRAQDDPPPTEAKGTLTPNCLTIASEKIPAEANSAWCAIFYHSTRDNLKWTSRSSTQSVVQNRSGARELVFGPVERKSISNIQREDGIDFCVPQSSGLDQTRTWMTICCGEKQFARQTATKRGRTTTQKVSLDIRSLLFARDDDEDAQINARTGLQKLCYEVA